MCAVQGDPPSSTTDDKIPSFSLPKDDNDAYPSLVPASDTSNSTGSVNSVNEAEHHKLFSWRRRHQTTPSRASSHSVTYARTKVPEIPLPIKAVRAMNCVYSSHGKPSAEQQHYRPPLTPKRSSLKHSDSSNEQKRVHFGNLEMRNYEIVLGDHPDCSSGPPVSHSCAYSFYTIHHMFARKSHENHSLLVCNHRLQLVGNIHQQKPYR